MEFLATGSFLCAACLVTSVPFVTSGMAVLSKQAHCTPAQRTSLRPNKKIPSIQEGGPTPGSRQGQWYEQVENRGSAPIVALALRYRCKTHPIAMPTTNPPGAAAGGGEVSLPPDFPMLFPNGDGIEIFDSLSADHPNFNIPSEDDARLELWLPDANYACSARVDAVLFADRSSGGNRHDLFQIYQKRQGIYEALVRSYPTVEAIANGQIDLPRALQALDRDERSLQAMPRFSGGGTNYGTKSVTVPFPESGWGTEDERGAAGQLYSAVESALSSDRGAARFPWKPAMVWHSSMNQRAPQSNAVQTRASVLVSQMQAWRMALKGNLKLPK